MNPSTPPLDAPEVKPDSRRRRRRWIAIGIAAALVLPLGGTAAWALDRFVIEHVEISDVSAYESSQAVAAAAAESARSAAEQADDSTIAAVSDGQSATSAGTTADDTASGTVDGSGFTSDDASVTISKMTTGSGSDTVTYYVADVVLSDATALRSAFAKNAFGLNIIENTSDIAADNNAVFAINGDYYGFRDTGIVIRNGVVYRDTGAREGLAFYRDGRVEVYDETATTADELVAAGVWNTLSFGPALVEYGSIVSGIDNVEVDTNVGNHSIQGNQPRTAVGVVSDNHLVFVVVDGRDTGYSRGVSMTELAQIMTGLGATTAYNLDGGGSSTMYFNGEVINQPSQGRERGTSDILYLAW